MGSERFSTMSFFHIFLTLTILFCVQSEELEERGLEPTIMCGKSTHKIIEVGKKTMSVFQTQTLTRRCTLVSKLTGGCSVEPYLRIFLSSKQRSTKVPKRRQNVRQICRNSTKSLLRFHQTNQELPRCFTRGRSENHCRHVSFFNVPKEGREVCREM